MFFATNRRQRRLIKELEEALRFRTQAYLLKKDELDRVLGQLASKTAECDQQLDNPLKFKGKTWDALEVARQLKEELRQAKVAARAKKNAKKRSKKS